MASLANLPTKCRFALLEISDDDNEEDEGERNESNTSRKITQGGSKHGQNSSDGGAAKSAKKSKKKKHKSKGNADAAEKPAPAPELNEWHNWRARDEQYVLSQFQRDLQAALEESKKEATAANKPKTQVEISEAITATGNGKEQKKKKEKAVAMSLDEFVSGLGAGKVEHPNQKLQPQQGSTRMMALDSFITVESTPVDTDTSTWHRVNGSSSVPVSVETPSQEPHNEKPPQGTKVKKSSRKRETSKSEEEPSKETGPEASEKVAQVKHS